MSLAQRPLLLAACVLASATCAAQDSIYPAEMRPPPGNPIYKCGSTYSNIPCEGAVPLGTKRVTRTYDTPPPQDRARQMARAQLPPQERQQCAAIENWIRNEEARLKGKQPTEAEEGELAIQRVHYREKRC